FEDFKAFNTNSCYDMQFLSDKKFVNNNEHIENNDNQLVLNDIFYHFDNVVTKSKKIILYPTLRQKSIIQLWFDACTCMYNETVKYIKNVTPFKYLPILRDLYKSVNDQGKDFKKFGTLYKEVLIL